MATHEYTLNAVKGAVLNPLDPQWASGSMQQMLMSARGGSGPNPTANPQLQALIGFDRTQLQQIQSEIVTSIKLRVYISTILLRGVAGNACFVELRSEYGKLPENWDSETVTYAIYSAGTGASAPPNNKMWQVNGSGSSITEEYDSYVEMGGPSVGIDKATACMLLSCYAYGAAECDMIVGPKNTSNWGPDTIPQLIVTTKDSKPNVSPISPKGSYKSSSSPIMFEWSYEDDTSGSQASYELQYKDATHADWTLAKSAASAEHSCTVDANTFASGEVSWRVRVTNDNPTPATSEWSAEANFIVQGAPQTPSLEATTTPRPLLTWIAPGQMAYQVSVDGIVEAQQYGNAKRYKVKRYLMDGAHSVAVRVQNEYGLWSEWSRLDIAVKNTPGSAITLAAYAQQNAVARLTWSSTEHKLYYVYRDGEIIAKTTDTEYYDRLSIGTCKYQVRGADGDNYTLSNFAMVTLTAAEPVIASVDEFEWISLRCSANRNRIRSTHIGQDVSYQYYAGREYPVAETAGQISKSFSFDAAFKDSNTAERFESLLGKNVIYKDSDGRIAAGMMMEITKISERFYDTYQCSIRQVDETEAVEYE